MPFGARLIFFVGVRHFEVGVGFVEVIIGEMHEHFICGWMYDRSNVRTQCKSHNPQHSAAPTQIVFCGLVIRLYTTPHNK